MQKWQFYTPRALRPQGWLRRQLEIQAEGLAGNLDKVWPDVRDSAWIGGSADSWERVPYWLDGFIPLAYLLERQDMIDRAGRYVDAIVERQQPDGWICPCAPEKRSEYDAWAVLLIAKTLTVYCECTDDAKTIDALYKMLRNFYTLLQSGEVKLFNWGKYRWFEGLIAVRYLHARRPEAWLVKLAELLRGQGVDYEEKVDLWKHPLYRWTYDTHVVNLAMMLKEEAVTCDLLQLPYTDKAERLYAVLAAHNGTPVGLFTGDECLAGLSPIQGTELCAVVEQMYSYELLYAYTGDAKWAERLERLAFNALPATFTDDMWAHQYVQQSNQIACVKFPGKPIFGTNGPESHLFGLEPNFGCCTANFGQGWPKFALTAFLHSGDTVLSAIPVPSRLDTADYTVELETEYPFENVFQYTATARKAFTLCVRIPSFAQNATVDGKPAADTTVDFRLRAGETRKITVAYETSPRFVSRPHDLACVQCGSLVFALPLAYRAVAAEYVRDGVERKFPYCDYELYGTGEWRYGYTGELPQVRYGKAGAIPFDSHRPPVTATATVRRVDWDCAPGYDAVCAIAPDAPVAAYGDPETVTLYPYGCAKLRMTELPIVRGR